MDLQHYLLNNILKFKFLGHFWHEEIIMLLLFKLRILFILYWKTGLWVWTFCHTTIHSKSPIYLKMKILLVQLCLTLFDPRDCSLPGSSVHGIFQARHWSGLPFLSSGGSSRPRDWTWVSHIADRFFNIWATREAQYI